MQAELKQLFDKIGEIKEQLKTGLMFNREIKFKIGNEDVIELRRDSDLRLAYGVMQYVECLIGEFSVDKSPDGQ